MQKSFWGLRPLARTPAHKTEEDQVYVEAYHISRYYRGRIHVVASDWVPKRIAMDQNRLIAHFKEILAHRHGLDRKLWFSGGQGRKCLVRVNTEMQPSRKSEELSISPKPAKKGMRKRLVRDENDRAFIDMVITALACQRSNLCKGEDEWAGSTRPSLAIVSIARSLHGMQEMRPSRGKLALDPTVSATLAVLSEMLFTIADAVEYQRGEVYGKSPWKALDDAIEVLKRLLGVAKCQQ